MNSPSLSIDELFAKLKAHDPGLRRHLQQRWDDFKASQNLASSHMPSSGTLRSASFLEEADGAPLLSPLEKQNVPLTNTELVGPWDVTAPHLRPEHAVSDHIKWLRQHDWSRTSLGPMSSWSRPLRQAVNHVLADPRAAVIWWGPQRICIYNSGYAVILAKRHPSALGMPKAEVWPELMQHDFGQACDKADATGEASSGDKGAFFVKRAGFLEEVYADWAITPIWGGTDYGYYNSLLDVTGQVVYQRQMETLLRLDKQTAEDTSVKQFWSDVLKALEPNKFEVPFAALYSTTQHIYDGSSDSSSHDDRWSMRSSSSVLDDRTWVLEGTIGIPSDSAFLPPQLDVSLAVELFSPHFEECLATSRVHLMTTKEGTLSSALHEVARSRAYEDQCTAAVLCPIGSAHRSARSGFLILGINPRREYDSIYQQFVRLLVRQAVTSLASVGVHEDEARQSRRAAELAEIEKHQLSQKLALTEMEVQQNEQRFRQVGEHMPVAMYEAAANGEILYGNDDYFKLMGQSPNDLSPVRFIDAIHRDSRSQAQNHWDHVLTGSPHRVELRLNKPYEDFDQNEQLEMDKMDLESWVLMSSVPIKDGAIVQGLMMDISRQKWMENLQRRKMIQAIERRRQQENFMDIIAHEARNPLSAITLCTDNILATLQDMLKLESDQVTFSRDTVETQLENAEIIMTCAQHQKRIIDDVLTLSKLDAGLLAIAPSKVQPREVLKQAMKMFEGDLQQADIDLSYNVDQSFEELAVDWVELDPGRMLQILINLVTNAIKFTKTQQSRNIMVTLSASLTPPSRSPVRYLDSNDLQNGNNHASYHAHGDNAVYVAVTVADSGCGIEESSLQKLFHRWQQASPKTYTEYGGSGLGLFISRELAMLQGGNIGVASEYGWGSTFEFYVRASKCSPLVHGRARSSSNNSPLAHERKRTRHTRLREHVHESVSGDSAHDAEESIPKVLHLLLVEDNLINQKVMFNQLVRAGHKVTIANHGVEALEHIRKTRAYTPHGEPLDIVLMDVEMPVMDGIECTRQIRAMEARGELSYHLGILAVTANVRAEQQSATLEAGMDSVVTKPFRMADLLPELERMQKIHGSGPPPEVSVQTRNVNITKET